MKRKRERKRENKEMDKQDKPKVETPWKDEDRELLRAQRILTTIPASIQYQLEHMNDNAFRHYIRYLHEYTREELIADANHIRKNSIRLRNIEGS